MGEWFVAQDALAVMVVGVVWFTLLYEGTANDNASSARPMLTSRCMG
jgi:hypothetical protein